MLVSMSGNGFSYSSSEFKKGVVWLLDEVKKARLVNGNPFDSVEAYYVLNKLGLVSLDEIIPEFNTPELWEDESHFELTRDNPHTLWYLSKLGLNENEYFKNTLEDLIRIQSIEGFFDVNEFRHTGPLRVLSIARSESKHLDNAIKYWLENGGADSPKTLAVGILSLSEINYEMFEKEINEQINFLEAKQNENGSWNFSFSDNSASGLSLTETAYSVYAIAQCCGPEINTVKKGVNWLKNNQKANGSWDECIRYTAECLIALLTAGEGPKISKESADFEFEKYQQALKNQRPCFVHTSPLYQGHLHVKKIHECIGQMLARAEKEIRIASPFIDMFYEELINLKQNSPELSIKIITRPKREIEGVRGKIAQNVVDLLGIATKDNVLQSPILHSRIVIIDDSEVLVSSCDLTRDQLFDEFNAGIWTSEKEAVKEAIKYFENLFEMERNNKTAKQ